MSDDYITLKKGSVSVRVKKEHAKDYTSQGYTVVSSKKSSKSSSSKKSSSGSKKYYTKNVIIKTADGKYITISGSDEYTKRKIAEYGGTVVKTVYVESGTGKEYKESELEGAKFSSSIYGKPKASSSKKSSSGPTYKYNATTKIMIINGKRYEGVEGYIKNADGTIKAILVKRDGATYTLNPNTGEVYAIKKGTMYADFTKGKIYEGTRELNPLLEADYKKIKDLGITINLDNEGKALSNWYWKEKEKEAKLWGAKSFAYAIAEQINENQGFEVAEVYKKNGKYYVRIKPEIAERSQLDEVLLPNIVRLYKKKFKYAKAKVKGNLVEIEQKPITEPSYYMSKYFSSDPIKSLSVSFTNENVGDVVIETTKGTKTTLEKLAKTNPEKYKAFMRVYGSEISRLQAGIGAELGKKLKMTPSIKFENGKIIIPKEALKMLKPVVETKPKGINFTFTPAKDKTQKQPEFKSKAEYYKKLAEQYPKFAFDEQIKWVYSWGATFEKGVNELAKFGHNINKGFSAIEDWVGIDLPFIGTAHDKEQVAMIDKKLAEIDKELEYKALYEARKNWATFWDLKKSPIERGKAFFIDTPAGAILTLGLGEVAIGGKVAEIGTKAPTVARALEVASANTKTFIAGGTFFTALEESQKTLSQPAYRPLEDKEAVLREFVAGGTSAVVMSNIQLGLMQQFKVIPTGTTATNIAKRLATSFGSGYAGGYTYEGAKEFMKTGKVSFEKAHQTGMMFGAFGMAVEGISVGIDLGKIPTVEGVKVQYKELTTGKTHTYYGLAVRKGTSAKPIIGLQDFKPTIGTPRIDVGKGVYEFKTPLGPAEAEILDKPLRDYAKRLVEDKFSQAEQKVLAQQYEAWAKKYSGKLPEGIKQIDWQDYYAGGLEATRLIWKAEAKPKLALKEVISKSDLFNEQATKKILEVLEKERAGVVVYGSMPQKMYLAEYMPRTPHDIDLMTFGKPPEVLAKKLVEKLKPIYGKNIRVSPERPSLVEIYKGGKWRHAFDIHSGYGGEYSITGATELSNYWIGYGLRTKNPLITKEGYAIISFGEQGARKGVSTLTPRPFGFMPEAHRLKDLADFITIGEFAKEELGIRAIEKPLTLFKSSIPEKILKSFGPTKLVAVPYTPSYAYSYTALTPSLSYTFVKTEAEYKASKVDYSYKPFSKLEYYYKPSKSIPFTYYYKKEYKYKPSYDYTYKPEYYYKPTPYKLKGYTYKGTEYETPPSPPYKFDYIYRSPPYKPSYDYTYRPPSQDYGYKYKFKYEIPYNYKYKTGYKYGFTLIKPPEKPPFVLPKPAFGFEKFKQKLALKLKLKKKKAYRQLLADLLSIQIAQNIWGRATQPKLTRKVWAYETKSAIGFVPTAEMLKTGKPERFRKPRLALKPIKLKKLISLITMRRLI